MGRTKIFFIFPYPILGALLASMSNKSVRIAMAAAAAQPTTVYEEESDLQLTVLRSISVVSGQARLDEKACVSALGAHVSRP